MARLTLTLALAAVPAALGNHLLGPMQDALDACALANCADGQAAFAAADGPFAAQFGVSLNTFLRCERWRVGDVFSTTMQPPYSLLKASHFAF